MPKASNDRVATLMKDIEQYHAEDRLRDGCRVWLRAVRPSDRDLLREGMHHLSPESAYRRFFTAKRELSEPELDYLTQLDFVNHVALVAFVDNSSGPLLVGAAGYIVEHSEVRPKSAEVAFVVPDAHQRLGIGAVLLRHLAAIARANGLRAFHALVLAENRPMMSVFRKSGLPMMTTCSEPGVLEVSLKLVP
jgi:GNAT superfamily N-acetyltransferase